MKNREHSYFEVACAVCNTLLASETGKGQCPVCHQAYRVDWPARESDTIKMPEYVTSSLLRKQAA